MLVARSRVLLKGKAKVSCVGRGEHIYIYVCLHLPPKRRPTGVYRIIYVQVGAVCINYHAVSWQKPSEWASAPLHKNFTPKVNVRRALCLDGGRRERFVAFICLECAPRMHWMEANPNRTNCGQCSGEGRLIYDLERSSKIQIRTPNAQPGVAEREVNYLLDWAPKWQSGHIFHFSRPWYIRRETFLKFMHCSCKRVG